ncbi:MAG TPA: regulatory protein RecX [Agromyces sp.]|nr:regulatory protein RecX [Agromyces sp.]
MNDASEHLAPVTYLPWAAPPTAPGDEASEVDRHELSTDDAETQVASAPHASRSGGRSSFGNGGGFGNSGGGAGSRRHARMSAVGDEEPVETGAERDARIDRLVVSRLRRSALSIAEVRSVLAEHGLDESEIEEWIERYERLGYLDDARLAEQLVHVNGSRRGRGSGAIMQELSRRGVDAGAARAAVGELDPEIERANAQAVAERRARQLTGLDRQTAERRLSAFLQRRGYPGDVVREAVKAALSADGS